LNPLQGMIQICAIISEKALPFDTLLTEDVKRFREEEVLLRKGPVRMGVLHWVRDVGEFVDVAIGVVVINDESIELARETTYLEIPTFPRGAGNSFLKKAASKLGYIEFVCLHSPPFLRSRFLYMMLTSRFPHFHSLAD
jgi:hypothetical protein